MIFLFTRFQMSESTHKLNADQTVAVATDVFWNEDMSTCPRGTKCQMLGEGGVAVWRCGGVRHLQRRSVLDRVVPIAEASQTYFKHTPLT